MSFDYPWLLLLAALLPLLTAVVVVRAERRRRARWQRLGDPAVVSRLAPAPAVHGAAWRATRLASACALAGVALAGPRWGVERSVNRSRGFDMVLALDASLSMLATDVKPSRLERMKQEVERLRALSNGDRIGLIVFAGRSYVLSPLTVDEGALDLFLENLDPSIVGQPGSSLAAAIRQGTDLLSIGTGGADRALVVMSDGEAFEPEADVVAAARRAASQGISLVTVGFGTAAGSTIPVRSADGTVSVKRDQDGNVVVTHYVPAMLQAAAAAANGTFIEAGATDKAARIRQALSTLRTRARTTTGGESRVPRFQIFLLPAVLLLLLDAFLPGYRRRDPIAPATRAAGTTAAALLILLAGNACAGVRESSDAGDAYQMKQYPRAAALYRTAIEHGDQRPRTIYNFGTTQLQLDSSAAAIEALERVADLPDPELRFRAQFNLGLAHLRRGLASSGTNGGEELDAALAAYRQALLMRPADLDATWNYELALHAKAAGGGGGGGSGSGQGGGGAASPPPGQSSAPQGNLGLQQAEQLLASAAREERDVQARQQRKRRTEPVFTGKDW